MGYSPPGSSVHGITQARILEWVAISFFRGLPHPGIKSVSPALAAGYFTAEPPDSRMQCYKEEEVMEEVSSHFLVLMMFGPFTSFPAPPCKEPGAHHWREAGQELGDLG